MTRAARTIRERREAAVVAADGVYVSRVVSDTLAAVSMVVPPE
jgi:hypothetical protein